MRAAILSTLLLVAACSGQRVERLTAGGQTYVIPSAQVTTVTRKPHTFIRITDNGLPFELVFDGRLQGRTDRTGAPVIFSVNDGNSPGVRYHRTRAGMIICRKAANARGSCGYQLQHGKNAWSLLIPRASLDQAEQIADDALTLLNRYSQRPS